MKENHNVSVSKSKPVQKQLWSTHNQKGKHYNVSNSRFIVAVVSRKLLMTRLRQMPSEEQPSRPFYDFEKTFWFALEGGQWGVIIFHEQTCQTRHYAQFPDITISSSAITPTLVSFHPTRYHIISHKQCLTRHCIQPVITSIERLLPNLRKHTQRAVTFIKSAVKNVALRFL